MSVSGGFQAVGIDKNPALESFLNEFAHRLVKAGGHFIVPVVLAVLDKHQVTHGSLLGGKWRRS